MSSIRSITDAPSSEPVSAPHGHGSLSASDQHQEQARDQPRSQPQIFESQPHLRSPSPASGPPRSHHLDEYHADPHRQAPRIAPRPATPSSSATVPPRYSGFTPIQRDTGSSGSNQDTPGTQGTAESPEMALSFSGDTSPTLHQNIFSARDGADVDSRRPSRRRTGPLSQISRERAALIRKLGACVDCRRRRVACHPSHHGMTWEDVVTKFQQAHIPTIHDLAPALAANRLSPPRAEAIEAMRAREAGDTRPLMDIRDEHEPHEPQAHHYSYEMETDPPQPAHEPSALERSVLAAHSQSIPRSRLSFSEHHERPVRTPLPGSSRSIPPLEMLQNTLQGTSSKVLLAKNRGRYVDCRVLLLIWQGDAQADVVENAARVLGSVFERNYHFTFQIQNIPATESGISRLAWRWLNLTLDGFIGNNDNRDVLKIVYYAGHTFLDTTREMILSNSKDLMRASMLRWGPIQSRLEESHSDMLLIMDAPYFPSPRLVRHTGVFEIFAAALSQDHVSSLGRTSFTLLLAEQLKIRAARGTPLSVAELHSILLSSYPKVVHERRPESEMLTSYPAPLYLQASSNARLPSIFLSPLQNNSPRTSASSASPGLLQFSITLNEDKVDVDAWNEWLRMIPEGVKDVRIEGRSRATLPWHDHE